MPDSRAPALNGRPIALPEPLFPLARVRLAVDCMGGDHGDRVTLPACRSFLDRHADAELILVGTAAALAVFGWGSGP